ncbi:hypothetical protein [Lignipirellula cremea]|uniref:Uncharacterized protein n=1 Tax=Lignipirellula cremea TaxID=2528010 RepID=A0A518DYV6_9BACT|nr:hypothetical protein [Lignipirellula cremea]QDU97032.1 hypothetical protein Pla8534_48570 [Lignipirellula cremea]
MKSLQIAQPAYTDIDLPSKHQLKQLSLRAMLAFGSRCVRRVQSMYASRHPGCEEAIENALRSVEAFARGERPQVNGAELRFMAKYAQHQGARYVAQAVTYLAHASLHADRNRDAEDAKTAVYKTWMAVASAYNAEPDLSFVFAARDDFDYLSVVSEAAYPEQGPSLDPGEQGLLGPFWVGAA